MKTLVIWILVGAIFVAMPLANCQSNKRIVILPAGGPFRDQEQRLVNELTTEVVNSGSVQIVERQKLEEIRKELVLEHSGAVDLNSAVQLGRLLGIPAIVLVRIDDVGGSPRNVTNGSKTTLYGNIWLSATAQVLSVETAVIIAAPTASFHRENQEMSETDTGKPAQRIYGFPVGGRKATTNGDPVVAVKKLTDEAFNSVAEELVPKIVSAIPATAQPQKLHKVAGAQEGLTFLNAGSAEWLKMGDTFQITRMVDSGMRDPDPPHQPIMRKKQVCLLTLSQVEDSLSSGKCKGELAQSGDVAVPSPE